MAFIGLGSPTAPSAAAPISRSRFSSVSRLDFASARAWSRVGTSAALGSRSGSTGKAQLSALKSLMRWVVGLAGTRTQNWPPPVPSARGSRRAALARRAYGSQPRGIDAQLAPQSIGEGSRVRSAEGRARTRNAKSDPATPTIITPRPWDSGDVSRRNWRGARRRTRPLLGRRRARRRPRRRHAGLGQRPARWRSRR